MTDTIAAPRIIQHPKPGDLKRPAETLHISSDALFTAGDVLFIEHNGCTYMLRKTRNGKLILTK